MSDYFDRDGHPMPVDWWYPKKYPREQQKFWAEKRVGRTETAGYDVSTVHLGLNHQHSGGEPLIFETMVFGEGKWDNEMDRYSTEEQAMRGHLAVVDRLRAGRPPFAHLDEDES